jgi:hypothetical protein
VTFGSGYATRFEFPVSADGKTWQTVRARYVRVCGLKPDGPGQPGTQMSIAELEVYQADR